MVKFQLPRSEHFLFIAVESFNGTVLGQYQNCNLGLKGSFLFFLVVFLVLFQFSSVHSLVIPVNIL